jgi:hypothetical protein
MDQVLFGKVADYSTGFIARIKQLIESFEGEPA